MSIDFLTFPYVPTHAHLFLYIVISSIVLSYPPYNDPAALVLSTEVFICCIHDNVIVEVSMGKDPAIPRSIIPQLGSRQSNNVKSPSSRDPVPTPHPAHIDPAGHFTVDIELTRCSYAIMAPQGQLIGEGFVQNRSWPRKRCVKNEAN